MTIYERAELATQARVAKADNRAQAVLALIEQGECVKRAAYRIGVSVRTARRYRRRWSA